MSTKVTPTAAELNSNNKAAITDKRGTNQNTSSLQTSHERKRSRQASIDKIPRLDLSKAEKFANLENPYAYLLENSKSTGKESVKISNLSQTNLIETSQV